MTRPIVCSSCGAPTPNSYRLCDDCRRSLVVADRAAQGLSATADDPSVVAVAAFHIRRAMSSAGATAPSVSCTAAGAHQGAIGTAETHPARPGSLRPRSAPGRPTLERTA